MGILEGNAGLSVSAGSPVPPSSPLDFISVMPIAAWWTRKLFSGDVEACINALRGPGFAVSQNIPFAPNGDIDRANLAAFSTTNDSQLNVWKDQVPPGAGNNLGGGFLNQGPLIYSGATGIELEGNIPVAKFNGDSLGRNDACGLVGDPALTIAWKMNAVPATPSVDFPTILSIGTNLTPEINIFFDTDGSTEEAVSVGDAVGAFGIRWVLPLGTVFGVYNYFIITKPLASGYSNTWKLYINGADQGAPLSTNGPITLSDQLTLLGDFGPTGGFPFKGKLPGMIIYDQVLSSNNFNVLNSFLQSQ